MVAITGRSPSTIGTDAFQEADIRASPCRSPSTTSWSATPRTSRRRSPRHSTSPRRAAGPGAGGHPQGHAAGAVHVQLAAYSGPSRVQAEHHRHGQIREAAQLIPARKPVLYVGGG